MNPNVFIMLTITHMTSCMIVGGFMGKVFMHQIEQLGK